MAIVQADAYLILEPTRQGYDGKLVGLAIDRMVKTKPRPGVKEVAVHLIIQVDTAIFQSPEPEVTVRINDKRAVIVPEIDVDVPAEPENPDEGDELAAIEASPAP